MRKKTVDEELLRKSYDESLVARGEERKKRAKFMRRDILKYRMIIFFGKRKNTQ